MAGVNGVTTAVISILGKLDPSVQKSVEKATKGMTGLKLAAVASFTAIGASAAASAKYLYSLGTEMDGAYDTIRIGTGATGKVLEGLKDDFEAVFASMPTSSENASKAVADLNTKLGLSGETLQEVSKQALYLSDKLGAGELSGVIDTSSRAFKAFSVAEEDMADKMDYLFKVSQSTGIVYEELAEKTSEFGATFQALGYDFESTSTLIGQMYKEGADLGGILGGLKGAMDSFASEGLDAGKTLDSYIEKIRNASTQTEALSIASEAFGGDATVMVDAIRSGKLMTGALTAELVKSTETIEGAAKDTMSFSEKMQIMKNKMKVSLAPLGNSVFNSLDALIPLVETGIKALSGIIEKFGSNIPSLVPKISGVVQKIIEVFNKILPVITGIIDKIASGAVKVGKVVLPVIVGTVKSVSSLVGGIVESVGALFERLKPRFDEVAGKLGAAFESAMPILILMEDKILGGLETGFRAVAGVIGFVVDHLKVFTPIIAGVTAAIGAYKAVTIAMTVAQKSHLVITKATTVAQKAYLAITKAVEFATKLFNGTLKANPIGLVCTAIGLLVAAGVALYQNWDTVTAKCSELWEKIKAVFEAIGSKVAEIFSNIKAVVSGAISGIIERFPLIGVYFDVVKNQIQSIVEAIKGIFGGVIDFVKNVFTGNWQGAWEGVKKIFSSIFDGLTGIIKAPLNGIISIVNKVIGSINGVGFTIPDWVPLVGGKSFALNIPEIPMFAKGGIATSPSIVGEGGYAEYVISTDPKYRARSLNLITQAAEAVKSPLSNVSSMEETANALDSHVVEMVTNNNTRNGGAINVSFSPVINSKGSGGVSDIMEALRARLPELVDMIQMAMENEAQGAY